jgi:hypothetical protein
LERYVAAEYRLAEARRAVEMRSEVAAEEAAALRKFTD